MRYSLKTPTTEVLLKIGFKIATAKSITSVHDEVEFDFNAWKCPEPKIC